MKRKFWIALLPLCGCFCVEAGAQSLSALKSELSTPDPSYGSRVEVEEHDGAASAVRSMLDYVVTHRFKRESSMIYIILKIGHWDLI